MILGRLIASTALTVALTATAHAAPTKAQLDKIAPGMTREEVSTLAGAPQKRSFNGRFEAFQYCRNKFFSEEHTTVWLRDGKVVGMASQDQPPYAMIACTGGFPVVDWSGVPLDASVQGDGGQKPGGGSQPANGGSATGTAFKVGATTLMTAAHVVENSTKIEVRCPGMTAMPATVVQRSRATDIAVLSVPVASTRWLPVASTADIVLGDPVFVIGFPMSDMLGSNPRFNDGTVSALSGFDSDASFLQISSPIQPGNSGGPVVSPTRGVVGVVSSTAAAGAFYQRSGGVLPQNINFAARADLGLNLDRTLKTSAAPVAVADALASTCFVEVQLAS